MATGVAPPLISVAMAMAMPAVRDAFHAVVHNTAVNLDAYTAAHITHPNGKAQADLVRAAYVWAGRRHEAAYVQARGTRTAADDHENLAAIAKVFTGPERSLPLYVPADQRRY
ncbi:hypothetical protein DL771_008269 [Monosporascus sp. 5C6A]|nr:hypothetical protein DL771_008269 [Monosporascus sp. 5C6A]